jgi:sugar/nucleoside kinase (ribokinase family)
LFDLKADEVKLEAIPSPSQGDSRDVFDVLVRGRSSVDLTFLGLPHLPHLGEEYNATAFGMNPGASFINANATSKLGLRTGYATDLGSDFFSRYILEHMRAAGIDETFLRLHDLDLTAISAGLSFPEDRTFISWNASDDFQNRGVLLEDLQRHSIRCLFTHRHFPDDIYMEARRQGTLICIDTSWDREYLKSDRVKAAIAQADVFVPNLPEACVITGANHAKGALAALTDAAPMVAIKTGGDGAIGCTRGRVYHVPALPVDVVDTTGAGDNFDAGFIYGMLHDFSFDQCLRCAVAAGSLSTRYAGGVLGSPTEAELLAAVEQLEYIEKHA